MDNHVIQSNDMKVTWFACLRYWLIHLCDLSFITKICWLYFRARAPITINSWYWNYLKFVHTTRIDPNTRMNNFVSVVKSHNLTVDPQTGIIAIGNSFLNWSQEKERFWGTSMMLQHLRRNSVMIITYLTIKSESYLTLENVPRGTPVPYIMIIKLL